MKWLRQLIALGMIGLAVLLAISMSSSASEGLKSENWAVPKGLREYKVTRIVDGDTIEVSGLGRVRYIGVNTPETKHPSKPVEYYGHEAEEANRRLVGGKTVKLEFDVQQRDQYGRVLAYVYVGSTFVNAWLVENGFAQVMTIPPNVKYANLFLQLQAEAREAGRGLWAQEKAEEGESGEVYWASKESDKFHLPSCRWAKRISEENLIVFKTKEAALAAGYKPCSTCRP